MELLLILLPLLALGALSGDGGGGADEEIAPLPPSPDPTNSTIARDTNLASTLTGDAVANLMLGAGGADTISGGAGDDLLLGELGADSISGDAGNDILLGAWGNDSLTGGAGDDLMVGGSGYDQMAGGTDDDFMAGYSGRDTLIGDDGDDVLLGLEPPQSVQASDLPNIDTAELESATRAAFGSNLTDSDFRRVLTGLTNTTVSEVGPDLLEGGVGNDVLVGDYGDLLRGGAGIDEFAVLSTAGGDVVNVQDFDPATETLAILVNGPATGALTFANDAVGDGLDVLLDGVRVANLEGVFANQIRPGSLTLERL